MYKIVVFLMIQTFYLKYINHTKPHTQFIFNVLEFFNEGALIILAYVMIGYSEVMPFSSSENTLAGILSIAIVATICSANLFVLGKLSIEKMILKCKKKK